MTRWGNSYSHFPSGGNSSGRRDYDDGLLLPIAICFLLGVPGLIIFGSLAVAGYKQKQAIEERPKVIAYKEADKNHNGRWEDSELTQFAEELGIITNKGNNSEDNSLSNREPDISFNFFYLTSKIKSVDNAIFRKYISNKIDKDGNGSLNYKELCNIDYIFTDYDKQEILIERKASPKTIENLCKYVKEDFNTGMDIDEDTKRYLQENYVSK